MKSADTARALPVATPRRVRAYALTLLKRHPVGLGAALALHGLAAAAGLVTPRLLGHLVEGVGGGSVNVDTVALAITAFVVIQGVLTRYAYLLSSRLGEQVLAELREEYMDGVLDLPLSTVESAGTGDLVSRSSRDVGALASTIRFAAPDTLIASVTILFTGVALVLVGPLLALPCLIAAPVMWVAMRWYLPRAEIAYRRENEAWATLTHGLAETVAGARTVEALGRQDARHRRGDDDIAESWATERHSLWLRTVLFPVTEVSCTLPVVATLLAGGALYLHDMASLAQVTAATLYVQQLMSPVDRLLMVLDQLQGAGASLARLLGVRDVPADRTVTVEGTDPDDPRYRTLRAERVRYGYREGHEVLHGIDLTLRPGERLAVVGPSGAGKSTLARLLAGINGPLSGAVVLAPETGGDGVPLVALPTTELRGHVALVTQEHHVFRGTLRDNVVMARPGASDEQIRRALAAVEWDGPGLDTEVGSGGADLTPAQAQQVALARLVLSDPHTLVLDEATSLLDPRAARRLERSLAAVVANRTVVAIAHRLHTAHDADRVAVVEHGRITELGTHDELLAADGSYAALWASWHGVPDERGDGLSGRAPAGMP